MRLLAAGGTIAMSGARAVPALDAAGLISALPQLAAVPQLTAENVLALPGPQISLAQALTVSVRAGEIAAGGDGVVVTTGTDTLEELAVLTALSYGGDIPIVFTGANRPASRPGADGPANLLDAVALAGAADAQGLGVVAVFGGEIHAGLTVRKVDSTGPAAFGSPAAGPLGRIVEGRVWLHARPIRPAPLRPRELTGRVPILTAVLGRRRCPPAHGGRAKRRPCRRGAGRRASPAGDARRATDGGHRIPVLITGRPERAQMLFATYGFEGAEPDLRGTEAIAVPFLSAPAARIALLCCLGAGLSRHQTAAALKHWDARLGPE